MLSVVVIQRGKDRREREERWIETFVQAAVRLQVFSVAEVTRSLDTHIYRLPVIKLHHNQSFKCVCGQCFDNSPGEVGEVGGVGGGLLLQLLIKAHCGHCWWWLMGET